MLTVDWEHVSPIHAGGAIVILAVLIQTTLLFFRRIRSPAMSITVKWGHDRLYISLSDPNDRLEVLRKTIADQTGLAPGSFKLIHAGGVMKDDNAPVSAYGIGPKSVIALVGGSVTDAPLPPSSSSSSVQSKPSTEEDSIAVIRGEVERVQSQLVPALDSFLIAINRIASTSLDPSDRTTSLTGSKSSDTSGAALPSESGTAPDLDMEHRRLGEEHLQALLRLDVLALDGGWSAARAERKNAIKLVQRHLSRLDDGWRERSEHSKSLS